MGLTSLNKVIIYLFKENYLFFYCQYLVQTNQFSRVDLKFLLGGHTCGFCDRRFCYKTICNNRNPLQMVMVVKLNETGLTNIVIHEISLNMIKSFKTFLRNAYVSCQKDIKGYSFAVRKIG